MVLADSGPGVGHWDKYGGRYDCVVLNQKEQKSREEASWKVAVAAPCGGLW